MENNCVIDARGLSCPQPVLLTKKALSGKPDGCYEVIVDNGAARENVTRFATNAGYQVKLEERDGADHLLLKK